MTDPGTVQVEGTGETVGEAKWAALRELERLVPALDREAVEFQIVSEGERGLLGVGYAPARVVAIASGSPSPPVERSTEATEAREFVERIANVIGASVTTSVSDDAGVVTVTCAGADLGLLIGKHGQTIDAIQYLANALARAAGQEHSVIVDAAGYRARRAASLATAARRSAQRAAATGRPVEMEPMTAVERRIVHESLKDDPEVETASEGSEPNRYVVVVPRHDAG
ncbi:MAG TPA: RNA-binding cell elongation regulator Jag/EloR [Gaiellaceae bacterium]|nr:RNA-binding cell elongation regulator Jag/EloR [Gaiellaceae bacterium]